MYFYYEFYVSLASSANNGGKCSFNACWFLTKTIKYRKKDGANAWGLKIPLAYTENVHLWTICEIIFRVVGPWKFHVVLEKSLKIGCIFLYEPCINYAVIHNIYPLSFRYRKTGNKKVQKCFAMIAAKQVEKLWIMKTN